MCGVVGMIGENKRLLKKLIEESQIRGLHAFGICFDGHKVVKALSPGPIMDAINKTDFKSCIAHNRYSTSGDYTIEENNQPIVISDKILVWNGVISQAKREKNEKKFDVKLETDNDGEIFLHQKDPLKFIEGVGSFAGLWYENRRLHALRNARRPLYFATEGPLTVMASTKDILKRAGVSSPKPAFENHLFSWAIP